MTPAYYLQGTTDFTDTTKVVRESEPYATAAGSGKADNAVVNPASNGYRIPTMAEWEYAVRGGDQNAAAWNYQYVGCDSLEEALAMSVYSCQSSGSADVKSKTPTQNGLYDLSGNVSEWCWDKLTEDKHYARYANWYYNNNNRFFYYRFRRGFYCWELF